MLGGQHVKYLLCKTKLLELILLFAPTSPRQPVPKLSGNFGTGDVPLSHISQPKFPWKFRDRKHLATSSHCCTLTSFLMLIASLQHCSMLSCSRQALNKKPNSGNLRCILEGKLENGFILCSLAQQPPPGLPAKPHRTTYVEATSWRRTSTKFNKS